MNPRGNAESSQDEHRFYLQVVHRVWIVDSQECEQSHIADSQVVHSILTHRTFTG